MSFIKLQIKARLAINLAFPSHSPPVSFFFNVFIIYLFIYVCPSPSCPQLNVHSCIFTRTYTARMKYCQQFPVALYHSILSQVLAKVLILKHLSHMDLKCHLIIRYRTCSPSATKYLWVPQCMCCQ